MPSKTTIVQIFPITVFACAIAAILSSFWATKPYRESQTANCPSCDIAPTIGSLLQRIEKVQAYGQDWYVFRCAGWVYGSISRSVQELLITFDPAQKEPSPRCWISKPQAEQRITALHLEFASQAQLQNMLNFQ